MTFWLHFFAVQEFKNGGTKAESVRLNLKLQLCVKAANRCTPSWNPILVSDIDLILAKKQIDFF